MTRIVSGWLSVSVVAVLALSAAAQTTQDSSTSLGPSLGSYARSVKKTDNKQAAKTFDNDNLPTQDTLSVVGKASSTSDSQASTDATKTEAAKTDNDGAASGSTDTANDAAARDQHKSAKLPTVQPGESQEERQKTYDQWQQQLADQKGRVDLLSRELDVMQREYKLRAAEMYGDAGSRLRNETTWDKEDADYKQKIADKQKALDQAKAETDELQEDARKAGVPSSTTESTDTK